MDATSPQDDAATARLRAKEARKAARNQAIKEDIGEIMPVRRRDLANADMQRELIDENRSRVQQRLMREDQKESDERPRSRSRERKRQGRDVSFICKHSAEQDTTNAYPSSQPSTPRTPQERAQADPDVSGAAPRTPVVLDSSVEQLSASYGYVAPAATATMQPVAASYFGGGSNTLAMDVAATVMPVPAVSASAGLPPRGPLGALASAVSSTNRPAASAGLGIASSGAGARRKVGVYEEDIATGDFRRVNAGLMQQIGAKLGPTMTMSAALLQAKHSRHKQGGGGGCCGCGGGRGAAKKTSSGLGSSSVAELDPSQRESMYGDIGLIMQSVCRIAQGLLAGVLLVIILQLDRLTDPVRFVQFMGPVLPPLRIIMYVLAVLAFMGSSEQAMETKDALGAWFTRYAVINDAAGLRLASTVRYTWAATISYLCTCITVFASMPADNQLRALGARSEADLRSNTTLSDLISTWKGILALRFVLVLVGMLATMFAASTPTDVYRAMKDQAETEIRAAKAELAAGTAAKLLESTPHGASAPLAYADTPKAASVTAGTPNGGQGSFRGTPAAASAPLSTV